MSGGFQVELPDELVDEIVRRVRDSLIAEADAPEPWIGVEQAAEHLSCRRQRIYDLVGQRAANGFPVRKDGSRLLFKRSQLDRWVERGAGR